MAAECVCVCVVVDWANKSSGVYEHYYTCQLLAKQQPQRRMALGVTASAGEHAFGTRSTRACWHASTGEGGGDGDGGGTLRNCYLVNYFGLILRLRVYSLLHSGNARTAGCRAGSCVFIPLGIYDDGDSVSANERVCEMIVAAYFRDLLVVNVVVATILDYGHVAVVVIVVVVINFVISGRLGCRTVSQWLGRF